MTNSPQYVPMLVRAHLWSGHLVSESSTRSPTEGRAVAPVGMLVAVQLLACTLFATPALATDQPGLVKGVVEEAETGKPLPGANVAIRRAADSSLVSGTTTDSTGHFVVDDLPTGKYAVVVSFVGYSPLSRTITLTSGDPVRQLEPFELGEATAKMDGATVSARRPAITMEGSKKVYNFEKAQVALSSKSVVDVLRDLPSVRVDSDGNIQLRGNSGVSIHVNGEPVAMDGRSLVQYLKSLSGKNVKQVEINTNPSARHEAEGSSSIINIVLDRQEGRGLSGGFSASAESRPGVDGSANLGYGNDAWSLYGSYSYRHNQTETVEDLHRRAPSGNNSLLLDRSSSQEFAFGGHSFNAQIDYTPTEKTTLSLISTGNLHQTDNSQQVSIDRSSWTSTRDRRVGQTHDHVKLDERLSASHTFGQKKHKLSADLRYQFGDETDQVRDKRMSGPVPRTLETTGTSRHDASLKVDYSKPIGSWTVETGYKGTARWLDQTYSISRFDEAADRFAAVPRRAEGLQYDEQVHAGYGILQRTFGPLDAEVGVRFEHTQTTVNPTDDRAEDTQYGNFFPSASLNYNMGTGRRLSASYTNRVDRPSTFQLSAFSASDDQYVTFVGNPSLDPEQMHKGELSVMQKLGVGTLTVAPYVRRTTNAIEWKTVRSDSVTVRTFDNYDSQTAYGAELTSSLQFGEDIKANVSGNIFRRLTRGDVLDDGEARTSISFMGRANVTWTPRSDLRLQWSQSYRSPTTSGIGRRDAMTRASLSVEKTFWGENGTLGLRVEDPFNTSEFGFRKQTEDYRERVTRDWDGRSLSISFSYQFGNADKKRRPNQGADGGGMMGGG